MPNVIVLPETRISNCYLWADIIWQTDGVEANFEAYFQNGPELDGTVARYFGLCKILGLCSMQLRYQQT